MLPRENLRFKNKLCHACVWSNSNSRQQISDYFPKLTTETLFLKQGVIFKCLKGIEDKVRVSHD